MRIVVQVYLIIALFLVNGCAVNNKYTNYDFLFNQKTNDGLIILGTQYINQQFSNITPGFYIKNPANQTEILTAIDFGAWGMMDAITSPLKSNIDNIHIRRLPSGFYKIDSVWVRSPQVEGTLTPVPVSKYFDIFFSSPLYFRVIPGCVTYLGNFKIEYKGRAKDIRAEIGNFVIDNYIERDLKDFKEKWPHIPPQQVHTELLGEYKRLGILMGENEESIYIKNIYEGSLAEASGLKIGDILIKADGTAIHSRSEIIDIIYGIPDGGRLALQVRRNGTLKDFILEFPEMVYGKCSV